MKKADLVNELAKFTSTKKESVMAVEIMLNLIKKTLKKIKVWSLKCCTFLLILELMIMPIIGMSW